MKKLLILSVALLTAAGLQAQLTSSRAKKSKSVPAIPALPILQPCIQGTQNACGGPNSTSNSVCVPLLSYGDIKGTGKPGHCVNEVQWQNVQKIKRVRWHRTTRKPYGSLGSPCIVGKFGDCNVRQGLTCVAGPGADMTQFGRAGTCQKPVF